MSARQKPPGAVGGAHTHIDRGSYLFEIAKKYKRNPDNLCLKISFSYPMKENCTLKTSGWGGSTIPVLENATIQNICYLHGLAPRVYAVDIMDWENEKTIVQLQDYAGAGEPENPELFRKVCNVIEEHGGYHLFSDTDGGVWNSAGGKWVGFKAAGFRDKEVYRKKIEKMVGLDYQRHLANYNGKFNKDYA